MKDSASRVESGWDLVFAVAAIVALVAGYFALFPSPPKRAAAQSGEAAVLKVRNSIAELDEEILKSKAKLNAQTWNLSEEAMSSEVMALTQRLARMHRLRTVDFRVGKSIVTGGLQQIGFTALFEGASRDALNFAAELESPSSKLAVSQLKLTAKDEKGSVSLSLALTAFQAKEAS